MSYLAKINIVDDTNAGHEILLDRKLLIDKSQLNYVCSSLFKLLNPYHAVFQLKLRNN